ncbi:MAG: AAA family ATPase, partial [Bacteroidota bacterium]|nr:AAA family ATPase [Bacteroidota bacterium]
MEILFEIQNRLVEDTSLEFKRSLYHKINWDSRLIEIEGARGVGKTTLILQYIKSNYNSNDTSVLYFSADDPYFYTNSIVDIVDKFVKYGGCHVFIDEVHKYLPKHEHSDWSGEIKAIYDRYPKLRIVYSGSSIIQLMKGVGDLSRRVSPYFLQGLSFREYLELNKILEFKELSLDDVLNRHLPLSKQIISKIHIIPHFQDYLKFGYFPFYNQDKEKYYDRLKNVINVILDSDIPSVIDIQYQSIQKMKKLLAVVSTSAPYTPNLTETGKKIGITDQRTLLKYMHYMEKA